MKKLFIGLFIFILIVPAHAIINASLLKEANINKIDYLLIKYRPNINPIMSSYFSLPLIEYNRKTNKIDVYFNIIEDGLFKLHENERNGEFNLLIAMLSSQLQQFIGNEIDISDINAFIAGPRTIRDEDGKPIEMEMHKILFKNNKFTYTISDMKGKVTDTRYFDYKGYEPITIEVPSK